jgi:hypothetical protein
VALARFRAAILLAFLQSTWALSPLRRIAERQVRFGVDVKKRNPQHRAQEKE